MARKVRLLVGSLAASLALLLPAAVEAGHNDMFSCRTGKKGCPVSELGDANFELSLAVPHFVMFYAPWCGHCKQLAPKLKKAAKALEGSGVKIGAVDVEPNPKVQGKFPDIRGFPTLKFLPSANPKKAIDYNGPREDDAIAEFAKEQAKKSGVTLAEPIPMKANTELYTFFGRAALSKLPAMLLVGGSKQAASPGWLGKLATELRKADPNAAAKGDPEAETRRLLNEAAKATKLSVVKDGITTIIEAIDAEGAKGPPLGPPVVSAAFTNDPAAAAAFGLSAGDLPALVLASVDRKTAGGAVVVRAAKQAVSVKAGKATTLPAGESADRSTAKELLGYVRGMLPALADPSVLRSSAGDVDVVPKPLAVVELPAFPKPPNVVAAEERERKRKEREGGVAAVADAKSLEAHCYGLPAGKTCALLALKGGAAAAKEGGSEGAGELIAALARKFAKEGFAFAAVDAADASSSGVVEGLFGAAAAAASSPDAPDSPAAVAASLAGGGTVGLAVVKGGKRPRAASVLVGYAPSDAASAGDLEKHLDNVVGGGASFAKLKGGLPEWPAADDEDGDDASFSDDEL